MACETIVVTNTLSNNVCEGEYQKTPEIEQWVNTANPSCQLVKVFDAATSEYRWVFQVITDSGDTPPPGAEKAVTSFMPTLITLYGQTRLTYNLPGCATGLKTVGEYVDKYTAEELYLGAGYHNDWKLTNLHTEEHHYECENGSLVRKSGWHEGSIDTRLVYPTSHTQPTWRLWHFTGSVNGSWSEEDLGSCINDRSSIQQSYLYNNPSTNRPMEHEYTITVGNRVQFLYRYNEWAAFNDFIDEVWANKDDYTCYNASWYMDTGIFATSSSTEDCPADADWSGTGISISLGSGLSVPGEVTNLLATNDIPGAVTNLSATSQAPISINGYYPLYSSEELANAAENCGSHTHEFDGVTYWMPDCGTVYHGDYEVPGEVTGLSAEAYSFIGSTETSKYKAYCFNERTSTLSGPFVHEDIRAVTTKDNSAEMFCVNADKEIKKTLLTDFNDPNFEPFTDPFTDLITPMVDGDKGVVLSKSGEGFLYRGRYRSTPFANSTVGGGEVKQPLFFRDSYLSIAETNWMYLGDEHSEKQFYRVDLRFHKNSCGHLFMFVESEDGKVKGQYKGALKEHMKVFTNLRGRGFRICMMIATHNDYPWAMREMAVGYLVGKSF